MNTTPPLADELRSISMGLIWGIAFAIVMIVLGVLNPIQVVAYLIENQGLGEEGASAIAFVAGYTAPLTVGFFVIIFALLRGLHRQYSPQQQGVFAALILGITGFFAQALSFGLSPTYGSVPSGPLWLALPIYVLMGYFTSYGFELMICALVIGATLAIQVERSLHSSSQG